MPNSDAEMRRERSRAHFAAEFLPGADGLPGTPDARQANALEYLAHQAGKMREDISAIRVVIEKLASRP